MEPDKLLSFMVSCSSSSTRLELLDFFGLDTNAPSASAFNQQGTKLKPDCSPDTYDASFQIIRFPISGSFYECIVTNLPTAEFFPLLSHAKWSIEGAFRKLKYTIGLISLHACKPEYIKQEICAKLIAYNMTETLINYTILKRGHQTNRLMQNKSSH